MESPPSPPPPHLAALGLDAGSTTVKIVAVDPQGRLSWSCLEPTEPLVEAQSARLVALAGPHLPLVATGYGRGLVQNPTRRVTEITCHARGVFRSLGHGGTLVDIGGQDSKVIVIDSKGNVQDFAMSDRCAAGTGRFLENTARRLGVSLQEMGSLALGASGEAAISSTCTVFAETEVISLIAHGVPLGNILRGLHRALVGRVASLARVAGFAPPLMLSGGVAYNDAVRCMLGEALDAAVIVAPQPQLMGAYGAALVALEVSPP